MEMKATSSRAGNQDDDETTRAIVPVPIRSPLSSSSGQQRRQRSDDQSSRSCQEVLDLAHLLEMILRNLPAKKLFNCTLVSRDWYRVITNPHFLSCWKIPRNPTAIFIRRITLQDLYVIKFTHIPLGRITGVGATDRRRSTVSLNFAIDQQLHTVINQSSNGLMICSSFDPICHYLYNPTTKRHSRIPKPAQVEVISMNITFQPPVTYKIIAVCRSKDSRREYRVLALVPNQTILLWKNMGVNFPVLGKRDEVNYQYGVYMAGVIYWPCIFANGLLLYKVKENTLEWLAKVAQPDNDPSRIAYFGECQGKLRMVKYSSMKGAKFNMLELNTDNFMWFIKYHIDLSPRARLINRTVPLPIIVLALLPGDEEAEYLVVHLLGEVVSYNFKDGTVRKICDLGLRHYERVCLTSEPWNYVHSYLETPVPPRY